MSDEGNKKKIENAARDILKLSRNTLVVNLRFLDSAISRLKWEAYEGSIATNGRNLYFDATYILKSYKKDKNLPTRQFLHMLFHCIFQHYYVSLTIQREYWDLACDIAIENMINELELPSVVISVQGEQDKIIEFLKDNINIMTAEKIYHYFQKNPLSEGQMDKYKELFALDNHDPWYERVLQLDVVNENRTLQSETLEVLQDWKNIAKHIQTDLQTFGKRQGNTAGNLMQNLNAINREKYDYTSFLKKFAVMGEAMKINDDEFDYIFYTYGLNMYEKMPLIEPLEYKDVKRIKEFVIAIDTSGSVSGELVQKFVQKTYNILKQEESFFTKINLHIIQCDTCIQKDVKITSQEEFDDYLKTMTLHGFGGTDFRPVFSYVDKMIENIEFANLKGLIYFTDGWGTFPAVQPSYHTAFVFVDDDYNNPDVPVWAIKLVLQSEEL